MTTPLQCQGENLDMTAFTSCAHWLTTWRQNGGHATIHREVSIDEAMVGFKGRSSMKQFMPMKPTKRGYKVWCRCVAANGFTSDCEIYTGQSESGREQNLSSAVVLRLARPIFNKGFYLFYDNYFSSVALSRELLRHNTYSCGTARCNRREYPPELKNVHLQRGEFKSKVVDGIECLVWQDKKMCTLSRLSAQ